MKKDSRKLNEPPKRSLPEEIGNAVVFLASDGAGCITGATLNIDGGALLPVVAENRFGEN